MKKLPHTYWLLYCRAGFEQDCAQEALRHAKQQRPVIAGQPAVIANSGYAIIALNEQKLLYRELIFARQMIRLHHHITALPERDRLTPILDSIAGTSGIFGTLWLEVPDTNEGKSYCPPSRAAFSRCWKRRCVNKAVCGTIRMQCVYIFSSQTKIRS